MDAATDVVYNELWSGLLQPRNRVDAFIQAALTDVNTTEDIQCVSKKPDRYNNINIT